MESDFNLINRVNPKEWYFVFLLSITVVIITVIPLVVGYLMQNENYRFVGFLNPHEDMNSYFSWMKQAQKGNILFESKYTIEEPLCNLFMPYFLIVGMFSRYLHIPLVIMHQIMRVICGLALLFTSYLFCAYFINDILKRKIAFILICFSSGFGFVFSCLYHFFGFRLPPLLQIPCDQVHPQSITFWGINWFAHAELSIAIMLIVFLLVLESYRTGRTTLAIYAGLLNAISIFILPIKIFLTIFTLGLYSLYLVYKNKKIRSKVILNYLVLIFLTFLGSLHYLIAIIKNPSTRVYFTHAVFYNILGYLLGVGLVGFVAIWALFKIIKEHREDYYFLVVWAIGTFILIQSPLGFRMRMVEGLHIDLCILSSIGLFWLIEKWGWLKNGSLKKPGIIFIISFIIASSPSNLMHIIVDIRTATQIMHPYFLSKDLENLFDWMDSNLSEDKTVLASRKVGSFIPARTSLKTYIGHVGETLYKHRKQDELKKFMDNNTDDNFRLELLKKNKIDCLLVSDFERQLGDFNPEKAEYLKELYRSGSVVLYQVHFVNLK